jgi:hypothetical protein
MAKARGPYRVDPLRHKNKTATTPVAKYSDIVSDGGLDPRNKFDIPAAQRTWAGLIRGVRVEGDTVVITVKGGNDAARELCGALLEEKNA